MIKDPDHPKYNSRDCLANRDQKHTENYHKNLVYRKSIEFKKNSFQVYEKKNMLQVKIKLTIIDYFLLSKTPTILYEIKLS